MVVCITGGVGCGKSFVCSVLRNEFGVKILDSDSMTKSLYTKGSPVYKKVVDYFGPDCVDENGELIRAYIAKIVFNDSKALEILNTITHPATISLISEKIKDYIGCDDKLIVVESAIAHRSGYRAILDEFWYVYAPVNERIDRLKMFRGYSDELIMAIMKAQDDEEFFMKNSEELIINSNNISYDSMKHFFEELLKRKLKQ